jgi:biopolymer transport protein ExbB
MMRVRFVICVPLMLMALPAAAQQLAPAAASAAAPAPVVSTQQAPAAPAAEAPKTLLAAPAPQSSPSDDDAPRANTLPHELSPWSMFLAADIVVKVVMVGLALASLATWTIFFAKSAELGRARRRVAGALKRLRGVSDLEGAQAALAQDRSVVSGLLRATLHEIAQSHDLPDDEGVKERVASSFTDLVRTDARAARHGTGLLATIGATAPFVGLFGTVWGIMNSFIGISKAQTTNLAVVAPGIAEALLATAIGLVTAIPAVIIYNHFTRSTKSYLELVSRASGLLTRLLSRDLERRHVGVPISRAAE